MTFVQQFSAAVVLVMLTIVLHSAGTAALIQWVKARIDWRIHRFGPLRATVLMVRLTSLIVCLHVLEILLWAWFYRWKCFATWEPAFYFSATSYSTVGYGDVVLQRAWQALGPIESITGVLMCGLSASFLFAIVTRLVQHIESEELERARKSDIHVSPAPASPDSGAVAAINRKGD
jgi:Na+/H+-dicarboxylate symporter